MTWRNGPLDWVLPTPIREAAAHAPIRYTNAPLRSAVAAAHKGLRRTQVPITPGIVALTEYIQHTYAVTTAYKPGRSRPMIDSQRLDMHQAGRAVDFMTYNDHAKAHAIATFLIEHAAEIGIQFVVCDGNRWSAGQSGENRFKAYEGEVLHRDHPHVELTPEGGAMSTPWFRGRTAPHADTIVAMTNSEPVQIGDDGSGPSVITWAAIGIAVGTLAAIGGVVAFKR